MSFLIRATREETKLQAGDILRLNKATNLFSIERDGTGGLCPLNGTHDDKCYIALQDPLEFITICQIIAKAANLRVGRVIQHGDLIGFPLIE